MSRGYVKLKIIISSHGEVKATIYPTIVEGTLHDYSLETGEYELTVSVEGVGEK